MMSNINPKRILIGLIIFLIVIFIITITLTWILTLLTPESNYTIPQYSQPASNETVQNAEYDINVGSDKLKTDFSQSILKEGFSLKGNIYYTRSKDYKEAYIFGALVENNGQVYNCIWTSNSEDMVSGIIESINEHASMASGILKGSDAGFSEYTDGYSRINQKLLDDWQQQ